MKHANRAHAKYSASGFERIVACPGSVELSEGLPDKSSAAALAGTRCHEVLERILRGQSYRELSPTDEMIVHANHAAQFIEANYEDSARHSELLIETRVSLAFIHPEAFGTLDAAVVEHFGTLDILDFKYGTHLVNPKENYQLLFYALGVAHAHHWNFKRVRLSIIQPRARGYQGPAFWELGITALKNYVDFFRSTIERAEAAPDVFAEGEHCFFCKAKKICPLKQQAKSEKARAVFLAQPLNS